MKNKNLRYERKFEENLKLTKASKLIWHPAEVQTYYEKPQNSCCLFRKTFTLEEDVTKAVLHTFADTHYVLYVNGAEVGRGPCRSDPRWQYVDAYNILPYLKKGKNAGCIPVTRINPLYPQRLNERLGLEAPGCLWMKGKPEILRMRSVSLVGSRELRDSNREFAREVGRQAALQGYALVSGNARGADRTAQNACLEAGGYVISVVADELEKQPCHERILYISEDSFDEGFSAQRALSRNRCIHAWSDKTFVAQCAMEKGGTWDGTIKNLRFGWSSVFCYDDGSKAASELVQRGADRVDFSALSNIAKILPTVISMD